MLCRRHLRKIHTLASQPNMRRLPPLKTLPAFEVSAERLSFSAAAEQLHLTHGAISRQIKALEDHFGVPLFRRLNRRIELTPTGAALLPQVRQALQLLESAGAGLTAGAREEPLVISCLATFMMRWLIPRLYRFNAAHPGIEVRLSASHAPVDLGVGGVDLAIRIGRSPGPRSATARPFLADRIGPVMAPALRDKHRVRRPSDLRRVALLHADTRPRAWPDWLKITGTAGLEAMKGPRFEHTYFLLEAAAAGLGAAIGSYPLLEQDLASGRLVAPFGFLPSGRSYVLLRARRAPKSAKVATFAGWIAAEAERASTA
jgi:LysR family transcriptional regulator, glycine cleavage system transcriptional activator